MSLGKSSMARADRIYIGCVVLSILFGLWKFWPTLDAGLISDEYMEAAIIDGKVGS